MGETMLDTVQELLYTYNKKRPEGRFLYKGGIPYGVIGHAVPLGVALIVAVTISEAPVLSTQM